MTAEPPARGEDPASGDDQRLVVLGRIVGLFGVRGWVKVHSETSPPENILTYRTWLLRDRGQLAAHKLEQGNAHGKGVVARLAGWIKTMRPAPLSCCQPAWIPAVEPPPWTSITKLG